MEAHVKLLSVPPLFDEAVAADLVSSLSDELVDGSSTSSDFLTPLRLTGILKGQSGCWQITDALRAEFRAILVKENPNLFQRALDISLSHIRDRLTPTVRHIYGAANANLVISVLDLGREAGDDAAFDSVVRQLTEGHRLGRSSGEVVALVALAQLPSKPDRFRQTEFLLGMDAWRLYQREVAEKHFGRVITADVSDLADAISAHLIGSAMSRRGDHFNAVPLLHRSIATLRELGDIRGLCQVLISLGIAEREISAKILSQADDDELDTTETNSLISQADKNFQAAQDALDEAAGLAHELNDSHLEAGAHLELAACFARWNDIDTAIYESETARSLMPSSDREYIRVLTQLGSLYRQNGDYDSAGEVLNEAAMIALEKGGENIALARLLNVQAANERHRGRLSTARSYASNSVRIGRRLRDRRHLGQALITLALITIEQAERPPDLGQAGDLLIESEQIMNASHDSVGLGIIKRTRESLQRRQADLNETS
jgi:tetratricopeptide (TPR) repeat protein